MRLSIDGDVHLGRPALVRARAQSVADDDFDEGQPARLVHWHGATTESLFAHISLLEGGLDTTTWMEAVDEEEYRSIADLHRVG